MNRSLIYVAAEFGRSKSRPDGATSWGTAHDLNNGSLIISPLIKGNRVYGGVDPKTGLTYGFDPNTGEPTPDTKLFEGDVYSLLAQPGTFPLPPGATSRPLFAAERCRPLRAIFCWPGVAFDPLRVRAPSYGTRATPWVAAGATGGPAGRAGSRPRYFTADRGSR